MALQKPQHSLNSSSKTSASSGLQGAFRLLYWEGAFAIAYDTWVGPTYLSGLAGELGVSVFCVSLITSAAWIGAVGQLLGAWAYERVPSYKRYTLAMASASRGLWSLPLFFAVFWAWRQRARGVPFPIEGWFALTAGVACLAALFGASSASAWNSWVRGLVPERIRGRFFGTRHRYVVSAVMAAHVVAIACVDWRPNGMRVGFAMLGALALVSALTSTLLLGRVPEPEGSASHYVPASSSSSVFCRGSKLSFFGRILEPLRDARFRGVVIFGAAFNGMIQLASPYFPYWFTKELHLPMSQVAGWLALSNLGCMVASSFWGRHIDRTGDSRPVLRLAGSLVAISPLFYVLGSESWIRIIAPFDYFTNGMVWVGYQVALTTLVFKAIPSQGTALCFSIYAAFSGLAGALCSLLGGKLAVWLTPWGGFRALWVIAACGRLMAVWVLYRFLNLESRPPASKSSGQMTQRQEESECAPAPASTAAAAEALS